MGLAKLNPTKAARNTQQSPNPSLGQWEKFATRAKKFERQRVASTSGLAFTFTEGILVKAIRNGDWVLLDEINLASSETLQRLFGLIDGTSGTVTITERGDTTEVPRHPDFRIFAAMNPATDSGKKVRGGEERSDELASNAISSDERWEERSGNLMLHSAVTNNILLVASLLAPLLPARSSQDLPSSMRARFTEIYVPELTEASELREISSKYLSPHIARASTPTDPTKSPIYTTIQAYLKCRELSETTLVDGNNHKPRYTLRTLCRGLAASVSLMTTNKLPLYRSVFEGFQLAFNTQLEPTSQALLHKTLTSFLLPSPMSKKEVRLREERSDELTTPSQAAKTVRARTSIQDVLPP